MKTIRASSLTEHLVVVTLIGILAGLLLMITRQLRTSAQAVVCQHRLGQIAKACQMYAARHKGYEVRAVSPSGSENSRWYVVVLPFLSGATEPGLTTLQCPMADETDVELACGHAAPRGGGPTVCGSGNAQIQRRATEDVLVIHYNEAQLFDAWIEDLQNDDSRVALNYAPSVADGQGGLKKPEVRLCYDTPASPQADKNLGTRLYPPYRWRMPENVALHRKERETYTPTIDSLSQYGQVWIVIYYGFARYDQHGAKLHLDDIEAFRRFRAETGGGLFLLVSTTQDADEFNALLAGINSGLRVEKGPNYHDPEPRARNARSNSPSVMNNMAAFPYIELVDGVGDHPLTARFDGAYDVYLPNWAEFRGEVTYGRWTPGATGAGATLVQPPDFLQMYFAQPRLRPRGYVRRMYEVLVDITRPNPYARELIRTVEQDNLGRVFHRTLVGVVDSPEGGGRVVVAGNAQAFSCFQKHGYQCDIGTTSEAWLKNFGRLNHEALQFSRNVMEWLMGGRPSAPPPPSTPSTPPLPGDGVGTASHFGYNNRVAVDPETRTQHVNLIPTNPGETIRALDYAHFVAAQEGGAGRIAARHDGKANVLFMDGRVVSMTPEEIMSPGRNYWDLRK